MVKTLIILLAVNNPSLPWTSGLEAVFATHDPRNLAFTILFYISTAWSFVTIVNGLLKTFLYWKSYSVSDLGKILVFIRYLIGVSMKILALLFMIAPTLGILGFLNYYHIDSNFKYDPKIWPQYESIIEKTEHYEWFTLLPRLWHVCFFFACVVIVHIIIVSLMIYRYIKTRQVKRMNWLEVIQHGCITLLLPMIYEDWDCRPVQDYLTNWYSVRKEFILLSVLHLLENILLIIPSLFASIRNIERYNAMLYTLPEELKIYQVSIFILCVPLIFILFCLIESYLFIVYNKYGHPWARLLRPNFTLRPK